jgi:hypothetical protein
LLSGQAVFTRTVADSAVDYDTITGADVRHSISDSIDYSGAICTHYPRRRDRDSRQTRESENIQMIQCRGMNAHPYLAAPGLRIFDIRSELELVSSAVRGDGECSQRIS